MQEKEVCVTSLKAAVCLLVDTFNIYAGADGRAESLSFSEFKTMVQNELPELFKSQGTQKEMEDVFRGMDQNGDKVVNFEEFVTAVSTIACVFHKLCSTAAPMGGV